MSIFPIWELEQEPQRRYMITDKHKTLKHHVRGQTVLCKHKKQQAVEATKQQHTNSRKQYKIKAKHIKYQKELMKT